MPLVWVVGRLNATLDDGRLKDGVEHFNTRRYRQAEIASRSVPDSYAQEFGLLWLTGAGDFEDERRLLQEAVDSPEKLASQSRAGPGINENLAQARRLSSAIRRFDRAGGHQRAYTELLLITGEVDSFEPGDPLYPKGKIYAGRALHMIDPHRWAFASHAGRQIL